MTAKNVTTVGLLLLLLLPARSPFSATPSAQMSPSCNREMARQEAALRQFDADAKRESMNFMLDDARRAALSGVKARLEGDPTADGLAEMNQKWEEWQEYIEQGKTIETMLAKLSQCLKAGMKGCLNELLESNRESSRLLGRVNNALNEWIKSLGNDPISKAAERVERASGIMHNLTTQAGNLATGAATGAMQNCFRETERRVEARRDPVDTRSAQPQSPPLSPAHPAPQKSGGNGGTGSGGGMGARTVAALAAGGVAAGVGVYALNEYAKQAQCNQYETEANSKLNGVIDAVNALLQCGTSASCASSRQSGVNSALSSLNSTIGSWCACLGPDAATELTAEDKASVRDLFSQMRSLGVNPGTLPGCFR